MPFGNPAAFLGKKLKNKAKRKAAKVTGAYDTLKGVAKHFNQGADPGDDPVNSIVGPGASRGGFNYVR